MKIILFKFHWSLFWKTQLTIYQHWFRQWLGCEQVTSHQLNQCWPRCIAPYDVTRQCVEDTTYCRAIRIHSLSHNLVVGRVRSMAVCLPLRLCVEAVKESTLLGGWYFVTSTSVAAPIDGSRKLWRNWWVFGPFIIHVPLKWRHMSAMAPRFAGLSTVCPKACSG